MTKQQWREALKKQRQDFVNSCSAQDLISYTDKIKTSLFQIISVQNTDVVAGYWPFETEVDPRPLMCALYERGIRLALPIVRPHQKVLAFSLWTWEDPLIKGSFRTFVPCNQEEVIPTIILTPLLGFDCNKNRLGYGQGYYDATFKDLRSLEDQSPLCLIGLAYDCQKVSSPKELPRDTHDVLLDYVITERQVY